MKRLSAVLLALFLVAAVFASTALANVTKGKLVSYSHDAKSKTGTLVVKSKKGKTSFVVTDNANCGWGNGRQGNKVACKTLGAARYAGKPVTVTWQNPGGAKLASLVAVDLS